MLKYWKAGEKRWKTQKISNTRKNIQNMKKNMNENITTTQKYEKYYHNAKKYEKPEKYEKHKINGSGRESGETPATLAALAAPTENRIIVGLTPPFTTGPT